MKIKTTLLAVAMMLVMTSCTFPKHDKDDGNVSLALTEQPVSEPVSDEEEPSLADESDKVETEDYPDLEVPAELTSVPSQLLQREAYTVSYNKETKLPNWVAWHLTPSRSEGSAKRKDADFDEDTEVPTPRATDADYYSSGYDRGHMCPAGDNKMTMSAMTQSFLFTNICPQAPSLNRGDWNELELACRKWAKQYGDLYIVCGPILYRQKHKTIGKNKVVVPEAFFKVVLRMGDEPKAIGFIYKNEDGNRPKGDYVNTVDQVERITGMDFFPSLPDEIETKVEATANIDDW